MNITFDAVYIELNSMIREGLAEFSAKLTPNAPNILGVSVRDIRRLAKSYKDNYIDILSLPVNNILEINLLKGCVLGLCKIPIREKCKHIIELAKTFTTWQETDITSSSIKIKPQDREVVWETAVYLASQAREFEVRQGITLILGKLVNTDYVHKIFELLDTIPYGKYYIDMAVAWLLSECYIKYKDKTSAYLFGKNKLDLFTYNKARQKIIESFRVSKEDKEFVRSKIRIY